MRNKLAVITATVILCLLMMTLVACNPTKAHVIFNSNGGSLVSSVEISDTGEAVFPANPTKDGYIFDGWYFDNNIWSKPCESKKLSGKFEDVVVYAKWVVAGLEFTRVNNIYAVTNYTGLSAHVAIPESYKNYPVTTIAQNAFRNKDYLLSVEIPASIKAIQMAAFDDCYATTIYCVATSKPSEWHSSWNIDNRPIVWNCEKNTVADDGYKYFTADDNNRYAVDENGAKFVRYTGTDSSYTVASEIAFEKRTYAVTQIDSFAFTNCTTLTSVSLPLSINSIGASAFSNCINLSSFNINQSIKTIGKYAFNNCKSLASIVIPRTVEAIGSEAFYNCSALVIYCQNNQKPSSWHEYWAIYSESRRDKPIYWGFDSTKNYVTKDSLQYSIVNGSAVLSKYVGNAKTVTIPSYVLIGSLTYAVTTIGDEAFAYNGSVEKIVVPESVSTIGFSAFANCSSLFDINIPASIVSIAANAYSNCESLESILIPAGVTYIGADIFDGSKNVVINCEVGVKRGGWRYDWNYENGSPSTRTVNWGCNNITTNDTYNYVVHNNKVYLTRFKDTSAEVVVVPSQIDGKEVVSFSNIFQENNTLSSIIIPDTILRISDYAFYKCFKLKSVDLPASILSIGEYAFAGTAEDGENMSLESIYLDYEIMLNSIGNSAFAYCTELVSFNMPISTYSIGEKAFYECTSLSNIVLRNNITDVGENAFYNCDAITIYCELESEDLAPMGWDLLWKNSEQELNILWEQDTDQNYTINYYYQNIDNDDYTLNNSNVMVGAVGSTVITSPKTIQHFTFVAGLSTLSGEVLIGGTLELSLYYTRNSYTVTFESLLGEFESGDEVQTVRYGGSVVAPIYTRVGYALDSWSSSLTLVSKNKTITPVWTPNTDTEYSVYYYFQELDEDTYTADAYLTQNLTGTTDTTVSVIPLEFDHFTLNEQISTLEAIIAPDGTLRLKVYYTRDSYTVTFVSSGGTLQSGTEVISAKYGAGVTAPLYERAGYTQDGWDNEFDFIDQDIEICAVWEANLDTEYKVKYFFQNITDNKHTENVLLLENNTGETDTTASIDEPLEFPHFTLNETLSTLSKNISGDGSMVLELYYTRDCYTVTFVVNGGVLTVGSLEQSLRYGQDAEEPTLVRVGYTQIGWDSEFLAVEEDIVVEAVWEANIDTKYTVKYFFENKDNTSYTENEDMTLNLEGETDTLASIPYPEAVEHFKYESAMSLLQGNIKGDGTLLLSVYFSRERYTVTFSANGGVHNIGFQVQTVKFENDAFNVTYSKAGYTQNGWEHPLENVTSDFETWPIWVANDNEVVFDSNGGTGTMANLVIKSNESANLTKNTFVRPGYTFAGWATSRTGQKVYDDEAIYNMGTNRQYAIFAVWTLVTYNAVYTLNGGTLSISNPSTFTVATATTALNRPTKRGYTFVGWYDNAAFTGSIYTSIQKGTFGDKHFYAKWSAISYTINYVLNGGENNAGNPNTYTIEDANITLLNPTVSNCTFVGWYDSNGVNGNRVTLIKTNLLANYTLYAIWQYEDEGIKYDLANGFATVSGYTGTGGAVNIPATITIGVSSFDVLAIGNYAFSEVSTISNLSIAEGITSIGMYAFENCTKLISIVIPTTVTSIGDWAFYGCIALKSAIIPESVLSVGEWAFAYCSSMVAYCGASSLPVGWDSYWNYFSTNIVHWGINGTNFIESNGLQFVVKADKAQFTRYIGNGTSVGVSSSITIASKTYAVTSVGMFAFANCDKLTSIAIPNSVISIEGQALFGCSSLVSLTIPFVGTNRNATGNSALFGYIFGWTSYTSSTETVQTHRSGYTTNYYIPTSLTTVSIENATTLKYGAFSGCTTLTSVTVGVGLTSIGDYAFSGCTALSAYSVGGATPAVLQSIGNYAFKNCSSLEEITVPKSVATIGEGAFKGCIVLVVTCEITQENVPVGWDEDWNIDECLVVWQED